MDNKSKEYMELESRIERIFYDLDMGYLISVSEIKNIIGYIEQKIIELNEKLEVPDFDEDEESEE